MLAFCLSGWLSLGNLPSNNLLHVQRALVGGGTYVSASGELVSKLDASDMEQRLSKGLAHLSIQPVADCRLFVLTSVCWVSELELTQHEAYLRFIFKEAAR